MAIAGKGPTIVAVMWTETVIALMAIGLRLYTKGFITRNVGFDDYLIIVSWFMLMPYTVACTAATTQGFGQHSSDLTIEAFANATRSEIIGQTFCIIGIATSKASASVFLLRLAVVEWHKWILYITMFAVTGIAVVCALFDFIRCDPIAHVWNPYIPAKCWVSTEQFTAMSLAVGAADFILAALPWIILWKLNMKKKEKILITSSMSLGIFAMVCGVIRTVTLNGLSSRSDYSYETIGLILWSSTELMITILTATIPTYRPLYKALRGSLSSTGRRSSRGYRLDNLEEEGKKDLPPPAVKRRPKNDTTLMATAMSDNEHNDYHSERAILASGKGVQYSDS
ncbi:uncharacterized protein EAF01_010809 [Botrytis porri]|uniref:Rhodopsin domain-containing protein n=1 Tax=Botrytis porri TaxID=87229 RepID=A0A4Z1KST6_9HELO|nr:uncharacterized protein EAF01_010809 [Botrytis porri]KAF7889316.1 hypothetical protein EAF01_010809 [Botrytis porri]TGO86305.1 hypothetical protein BPOR_0315g00130 [Botrytis porri]